MMKVFVIMVIVLSIVGSSYIYAEYYKENNEFERESFHFISGYNNIQIAKEGNNYKLYINGEMAVLGTYENYSKFKEVEIYDSFDKTGFTNFIGRTISL
jgi:predicted membrane-bound spermidine synthase